VLEPTLYCTDCDFYMSRFRPTNKTTWIASYEDDWKTCRFHWML